MAQTPTTFTANNVKVMDTLTSVNVVNAHEIVATETITAKDDIVAEQDIKITGALTVTSTATFKSVVNADQGINIGSNSGLRFLGTNSAGQNFLQIGRTTGTPIYTPAPPLCPSAQTNQWWLQNYGGYISSAVNGNVNASLSMFTADWNGSGFIETSGVNEAGLGSNTLFLNYFCGRDVGICLNTGLSNGGGKVKVGNFLSATKHIEIGDVNGYSTNDPANIALEINTWNGKAIQVNSFGATNLPAYTIKDNNNNIPFTVFGDGKTTIKTSNVDAFNILDVTGLTAFNVDNTGKASIKTSNSEAINILNSSNNKVFILNNDGKAEIKTSNVEALKITPLNSTNPSFLVKSTGQTQIGNMKPLPASVHGNAMLSVDGKVVAKSFYVTINGSIWADYVFEKSYKKMNLKELENYVFTQKHLPNIPTAKQVEENGIDVTETTAKLLEKLEEAYLHIFELNKRIEKLEKKNNCTD
ncbi:MAG: hypothetical protein IM600_10195 [Bacteroidetes bacterium]|nr:hypothetical protein [Bacteroidota bacterium]MCA6443786.1 hypothetical protein [Bacteroidota bacterium]